MPSTYPTFAWGCAATDLSRLRRPLPARASTGRLCLWPYRRPAPRLPLKSGGPSLGAGLLGAARTSCRHLRGRALTRPLGAAPHPAPASRLPPSHPKVLHAHHERQGGMSISRRQEATNHSGFWHLASSIPNSIISIAQLQSPH